MHIAPRDFEHLRMLEIAQGGEPRFIIGFGKLGAMLNHFLPGIPLPVSLMAAIAATCTVGFGKPLATLLILFLLVDINAPGALFTGIVVGYCVNRLMEKTGSNG